MRKSTQKMIGTPFRGRVWSNEVKSRRGFSFLFDGRTVPLETLQFDVTRFFPSGKSRFVRRPNFPGHTLAERSTWPFNWVEHLRADFTLNL